MIKHTSLRFFDCRNHPQWIRSMRALSDLCNVGDQVYISCQRLLTAEERLFIEVIIEAFDFELVDGPYPMTEGKCQVQEGWTLQAISVDESEL